MDIEIFGENRLRHLDLSQEGRQDLATGPYVYYYYRAGADETLMLSDLSSLTLFVLDTASGLSVSYPCSGPKELMCFNAVQAEKTPLTVMATKGSVFLVAGTIEAHDSLKAGVQILPEERLYKVRKPWGFEIWVNGSSHPGYCLKKIRINQSTRTSLQYHRFKQETNVLYEGEAILHYKKDAKILNEEVTADNIDQKEIAAVTAIDVAPNIIHRIESKTDILLYEVSTPHLDDVIRLQDDAKRMDGRINGEHVNNG
ncbi:MAG: hypothetical protein ABW168_01490 [Sedimenticola sp.]